MAIVSRAHGPYKCHICVCYVLVIKPSSAPIHAGPLGTLPPAYILEIMLELEPELTRAHVAAMGRSGRIAMRCAGCGKCGYGSSRLFLFGCAAVTARPVVVLLVYY